MCDQPHVRDCCDDVDQLSASDKSEPDEVPCRAPFDPDLDCSDDDDDDDGDGDRQAEVPAAQSSFSLSGGSTAFSDRSHSIFDCLDSVDCQTLSSQNQDNITDREFAQPPPPSRKTSHPPSTCPTPPKKRGVPDYLVHPERWTRYSLEDVTETSDEDNRRAAHHFLSSLQQRRTDESPSDDQQRMIFSRPKRRLMSQPADQLSAVRGKEMGMHLSHLEEEDEEVREGEKPGGQRTEQSVEKTEDRETDADKDMSGAVDQAEGKTEQKTEEARPGFSSFRKTKGKNYRKSSGHEDN